MNPIFLHIFGFIFCAAVIVSSGYRLSRYGNIMADMLGWGKMFMGLILIASITSMPEFMNSISSVTILDTPDLAVGDIVGSCAVNVFIISIMDLFYNSKQPLTSVAQTGHVIAASFGIIMLSFVAVAIVMPNMFGQIGWIGGFSFLFIALYLISIRVVFLYEKKQAAIQAEKNTNQLTLKQVVFRFSVNALLVVGAALFLPYFGKFLSEASGLGQSFFGTLFIATSTSLPEIVVSISAIRLGAIDLAIGNIFGSNIFNIGILAVDDILYTKGPILYFTSPNHIITVLGTIIITSIGIAGIVYRENAKWKLAIDTAAIFLVYGLMIAALYSRSSQ